jgi:hypothetical protein
MAQNDHFFDCVAVVDLSPGGSVVIVNVMEVVTVIVIKIVNMIEIVIEIVIVL